jgi:ribonuclease J
LPLDVENADAMPLHPVPGFVAPDPSLLGVVISHPHQDHYGLAYRLPESTPFLIGAAAQRILEAALLFSPAGAKFKSVIHLEHKRPIVLGPFTITPYLVDHSAYDAYAVLIEADGKRVFYSGDLRAHGRKSKLFEDLVANPPKDVDALLMEGTTLGREDQSFPTEDDLESQFAKHIRQTKGMLLVCASSQNIDRLVTITRACIKTGRTFIIDMYTAEILRATGSERLPQAGWDCIKVFLPSSQKWRIIEQEAFDVARTYPRSQRIFPEELATAASKAVCLFRQSMIRDMERAECLNGAQLAYSLWSGYLAQDRSSSMLDWLKSHNINLVKCHTSGHAAVVDLIRLRRGFSGAKVIPVHTDLPADFGVMFDLPLLLLSDGVWLHL